MIAFEQLCAHCFHTWQETNYHDVLKVCKIPVKQQKETEKKLSRLLNEQDLFRKNPETLQAYIKEDTIWNLHTLPEHHQQQFCAITKQFILDAKAFDDTLADEEIFQALRNVWIILMLQMITRNRLFYHRAMFAYSMLYPYTDNYLDDTTRSMDDKKNFNKRLRLRLQGVAYDYPQSQEVIINQLIEEIEQVFDRKDNPDVYDSLLCIQRGQEDSLKQQMDPNNLLTLSIQKGGSSVLADGFLMDGTLSLEEQKFCMEYGFALQLADDLQDYEEDLRSGHFTLFREGDQEHLAKQLLQYVHDLLKCQTFCDDDMLCEVIQKGCLFLVLGAIIMQRELFSKLFLKNIFACFPISKEALKTFMTSKDTLSTSTILNLFIN